MPDYRSPEAIAYRRLYKLKAWLTLRERKLSADPFCEWCERRGLTAPATVVDHVVPHRGDLKMFYDWSNLCSMCAPCHDSAKQQVERRGYSNEIGVDGFPIDPKHPSNLTS